MLTDSELDDFLWDFVADGSTSAARMTEIVQQAKDANEYRQALRTVSKRGTVKDRALAIAILTLATDHAKEKGRNAH